jgi:hypothetical protein
MWKVRRVVKSGQVRRTGDDGTGDVDEFSQREL